MVIQNSHVRYQDVVTIGGEGASDEPVEKYTDAEFPPGKQGQPLLVDDNSIYEMLSSVDDWDIMSCD